ncbi:MAG: superinfection immunity protein [Pseudomonadota bacterium]
MEPLTGLIIFLYILPAIIAQQRMVARRSGIWVLTIFLGWTFIGWVAALVWASCGDTEERA